MITAPLFFTFTDALICAVAGGIITGTTAYLRKKSQCFDRVEKRSVRQSMAIIMLSEMIDEITNRLHPGEHINSTERIDKLLRDENDNL